jgi:hypothetical protein
VSHAFFPTSFRRDPQQPQDLHARIDAQLMERLEEAVDFVCLDALVQARRAQGQPAPTTDSVRDRAEFAASVRLFLTHLEEALLPALGTDQRRRLRVDTDAEDERARLKTQVALARELPDYWQRFDEIRSVFTAEYVTTGGPAPAASGGERRHTLGRLFGRR